MKKPPLTLVLTKAQIKMVAEHMANTIRLKEVYLYTPFDAGGFTDLTPKETRKLLKKCLTTALEAQGGKV